MRRLLFLVLLSVCIYMKLEAQQDMLNKRVTVNFKNSSLQKILSELEQSNNISFSYSSNVVPLEERISLSRKNTPLREILDEIFKKVEIDYQMIDNQVVLKKGVRKKATFLSAPTNLSANIHPFIKDDSVHKRKVSMLNDSVKVLKSEVERLNKVIDSLSSSIEKPKEQVSASDTINNKSIIDKLRLEMNNLNNKLNGLLQKLRTEDPEDKTTSDNKPTYYYIIYNEVPAGFKLPLVGFINRSRGWRHEVDLGFVNMTGGEMKGAQAGFINIINGSFSGIDLGFVNCVNDKAHGVQAGFVNISNGNYSGARFGYVNVNAGDAKGADFGFVNYNAGNFKGAKFGYVNLTRDDVSGAEFGYINFNRGQFEGARFGFLNLAKGKMDGFSAGFFNKATTLKGVHIAFINLCDTVKEGLPIAFLTIVKKGGYRSIEIGTSEVLHTQASFKIGIKKLYSVFSVAANFSDRFRWAYGMGIGSLFDLKPSVSAINIDALAYNVHEKGAGFTDEVFNMLYTLKIHYSRKISGKLLWYAGTSFNVMISDVKRPDNTYGSDMVKWNIFNHTDNKTNTKMWPGINAGIRF